MRWWALVVLALTGLVITLDVTIVTIVLQEAHEAPGLSDNRRQWVVIAYALTYGSLLLPGGPDRRLLGRERTVMVGVERRAG